VSDDRLQDEFILMKTEFVFRRNWVDGCNGSLEWSTTHCAATGERSDRGTVLCTTVAVPKQLLSHLAKLNQL